MQRKKIGTTITGIVAALIATPALATEGPVLEGDLIHGAKLYKTECADCHGAKGDGGRSGVALTDSGRMNQIRAQQMFAMVEKGAGLKNPKDHTFDKMSFLDTWDVVAYTRSLHMTLDQFFPEASRYITKSYELDKWGLERVEKAIKKKLRDKSAFVYTFFSFEGEEGSLRFIPQDPIKLDQLKKDKKSGYLVFLPFKTKGFDGEVGIGMDKGGKIVKVAVHPGAKGADLLNKSLSRFEGLGKKGQSEPFKVGGGRSMATLAEDIFPAYMRAMETVTMYDREEKERTWADD